MTPDQHSETETQRIECIAMAMAYGEYLRTCDAWRVDAVRTKDDNWAQIGSTSKKLFMHLASSAVAALSRPAATPEPAAAAARSDVELVKAYGREEFEEGRAYASSSGRIRSSLKETRDALLARLASRPAAPEPAELYARRVTIPYTNWRGELAEREIAPIRIFWGSNEWHKEPQWLIEAWDIAKSEIRTFALSGIGRTALASAGAGQVADGWQLVENAPEDGREVLAGFQGQFRWISFIAFCHPKTHGGVQQSGYAKPTHFRPLPAPPATDASRAAGTGEAE